MPPGSRISKKRQTARRILKNIRSPQFKCGFDKNVRSRDVLVQVACCFVFYFGGKN